MITLNSQLPTQNSKGFTPLETIGQPEKRKMSLAGFTLVEVIVSMVIVAATAAGIFASFIAAQGYVQRSRGRISGINAFRQQVETLRAEVNQLTWDTGKLAITDTNNNNCADSGDWTSWEILGGTFGGPPWNGQSRRCVSLVNSTDPNGPRQTDVQINWTEPGT